MSKLVRISILFCTIALPGIFYNPPPVLGHNVPGDSKQTEIGETDAPKADSLSVDLDFLSATLKESEVTLSWVTLSEFNNAGFRVQRKADDGSWGNIGFVEGAGTTNQPQSYKFSHFPSDDDSLTYRLRQEELDGAKHPTSKVQIGSHSGVPTSAGVTFVELKGRIGFSTSPDERPGIRIDFDSVATADTLRVKRFSTGPSGTDGINESNVSDYRFVIEAVSLETDPDNELRLEVSTLGGISDPSQVAVYKRPSAGEGSFSVLSSSFDSTENELVASVEKFSEFVLASDSEPLPVELVGFNARTESDAVQLTWKTASEKGNAGFEVQRRVSGKWESLSFVEGAGTTSETNRYSYRDTDVPYDLETVTYRLKQVDTDGTTSFSGTRKLEISAPNKFALKAPFPNPAQEQVTLRYALPRKTDLSIRIYDVLGRRVATLQRGVEDAGRKEIRVSTSDLSPGTYFVRMQAGEKLKTKRLTVVR